ncbi:class I SAM-dependent methyltransferase [Thermogemmatispora sp.]|uniref:class I SAM-dependent methyltransferase n=1 Tax=Thermogemmatispora sp. TaxID=1968838 RepID=UPI0035E42F8F
MPWWFRTRRRSGPAAPSPSPSPATEQERASVGVRVGEVAFPGRADEDTRRYLQEQPYLLPKDLKEVNRLDFQHYVLRAILKRNYLAPLQAPRQILDVGCGTGQWAYELAREFPQAGVIGLDLEPARNTTAPPPNYRFVAGDVRDGLPFEDNRFDFVHQRFFWAALPLAAWPGVVQELVRVTAPGGWVELLEASTDGTPTGPNGRRLQAMLRELATLRGLDGSDEVVRSLDRYLREAGLVEVERREIEVPLGDWGGRIGSLLALDFREVCVAMSGAVMKRFRLTQQEYEALLDVVAQEWNELKTKCRFVAAYGRKP